MTTEDFATEQRRIWDEIAPFWDAHLAAEPQALPIEPFVDVRAGMAVLDIGCGNGRFARHAASVPHPCFPWAMTVDVSDPSRKRTPIVRVFALLERIGALLPDALFRTAARWWLRLMRLRDRPYLTPGARMMAAPGQPVPHYNFHRPLHLLLAPFFAAGFVLDALEEPLGINVGPIEGERPGLMVFRLRLPG